MYKDASLQVWMRGNALLNGLKGEVLAAVAATLYKNDPLKWSQIMQQSGEFKDLMGPVINWFEGQGRKPDGGMIPKSGTLLK